MKNVMKKSLIILVLLVVFSYGWADELSIPIMDPTKQYETAMKDMVILGEALSDYMLDHTTPPKGGTVEELLGREMENGLTFAELYLSEMDEAKIPTKDPWGKSYLYFSKGKIFKVACGGCDKKFDGFKQKGIYIFEIAELGQGKDVIFSNHGFSYFPLKKSKINNYKNLLLYISKHIITQTIN